VSGRRVNAAIADSSSSLAAATAFSRMIRDPSSNTNGGGAPREEEEAVAASMLVIKTDFSNEIKDSKVAPNVFGATRDGMIVPGSNTVAKKRYRSPNSRATGTQHLLEHFTVIPFSE
jgi:hypothetical protein